MSEQQARNRYDALCADWRRIDRCLTNITVFGNYRWTPEMLKARRILVAMLNRRLRELSTTIADAFAEYLDAQELGVVEKAEVNRQQKAAIAAAA